MGRHPPGDVSWIWPQMTILQYVEGQFVDEGWVVEFDWREWLGVTVVDFATRTVRMHPATAELTLEENTRGGVTLPGAYDHKRGTT